MTRPATRLRLFGALELHAASSATAPDVLPQPKRVALLSYLALEGCGNHVRRDRLMALFWPESDQARARGSLRQALRFLRMHLGGELFQNRGREEVCVPAGLLECDALSFQAHVAGGEYETALGLYRGPFLDGFHLDGCRQFQAWVADRREGFSRDASEAAWGAAEGAHGRGDADAAAFWAKRTLALSRFDEPGVRRVLRLLIAVGDHAGAVRVFRGLERRLLEGFGARVSPDTRRMMEEVTLGDEQTLLDEEMSALPEPSGRRAGLERRASDERRCTDASEHPGPDRRVNRERRAGERRTKEDRRLGN